MAENSSITSSSDASTVDVITNKIFLLLNEMESFNAKLKKALTTFHDLDNKERQGCRDLLQIALNKANDIKARVEVLPDDN